MEPNEVPVFEPRSSPHQSSNDEKTETVELKREIGLFQGAGVIIGIVIGSGIFVSPIGVLQITRSAGLSLVMWVVTGLFSMLGALVYAELGVTIPRSGGEYIYILKTFGAWPAFLCMWIIFLVVGCASVAANAIIFAEYVLKPIFPTCDIPKWAVKSLAFVGTATLTGINCYHVKWATKTAVIFSVCKVIALMTIIVIGFIRLGKGNVESFNGLFQGSDWSPGMLAIAYYRGFWAFSGWNYLNFLTEEMENPARNLPLSIIISLSCVIVIYLAANVAYLVVLPPWELLHGTGGTAVAVAFAGKTMGIMAWIMPVCVGSSVFGSINGELLSITRVIFTGAVEGHMPSVIGMVNIKYLTPMPAVLMMFVVSVSFLYIDEAFYLIELFGFSMAIIFSMAVISLLYLRYKQPELPRPFKLPLVVPIIFLATNVFIVIMTVYQQPKDSLFGIGLIFAGLPLYIFGVAWKNKPKSVKTFIDHTTEIIQKTLMSIPPEKHFL